MGKGELQEIKRRAYHLKGRNRHTANNHKILRLVFAIESLWIKLGQMQDWIDANPDRKRAYELDSRWKETDPVEGVKGAT